MNRQAPNDIAEQALRGTPAAVGALASVWTQVGWVGGVTIAYIVIQIIYLVWKALWERREKIDAQARELRREAREERSVAAAEAREEARKQNEAMLLERLSQRSRPAPLEWVPTEGAPLETKKGRAA